MAVELPNPMPTIELPPTLADMLRDLITYRATGIAERDQEAGNE
jgi:hypothetical protein